MKKEYIAPKALLISVNNKDFIVTSLEGSNTTPIVPVEEEEEEE